MADETLRLRTTIVSDGALADLRALGREVGLLPRQAQRGIEQTNRELKALGDTIRRAGASLRTALPGLSAFGFSAAGLGFAARQTSSGLGELTKSIVALSHSSRELGLTTAQLKGLTVAAERVGIAPEAMATALQTFRRNTEDFRLRTGALREEMNALSAGPLMSRIAGAKTQMEALQHAFDFAAAADKFDKTGVTSRRVLEKLFGSAELARLKWKEMQEAIGAEPVLSAEQLATAKKFNDLVININRSMRNLLQRGVLTFFDQFEKEKLVVQWFVDKFKEIEGATDRIRNMLRAPPGPGGGMKLPPSMFKGRGGGRKLQSFQHGGVFGARPGQDLLQGSANTLTATHTKAVYAALTQFASFQTSAGGGGGPGGFAGGGGGGGGGSLSGGAPAGGQTPSDATQAAQVPGQGSSGPLGLPAVPGAPGATAPGQGTGGPLGLPMVPGAPGTAPAGQGTAEAGGGADFLRKQRQPLVDQLNADPLLKKQLADLAYRENHNSPEAMTAVVESLYNRTIALNEKRKAQGKAPLSLRQMMTGGFYGPVNRHGLGTRHASKAAMDAVDRAASSNLIRGATDQGSGNDPNVRHPGGKVVIGGETFNDWGAIGHDYAAKWRQNQQRLMRESDEKAKREARAPQTADAPPAQGFSDEPEGEVEFGMPTIGTPTPAAPVAPLTGSGGIAERMAYTEGIDRLGTYRPGGRESENVETRARDPSLRPSLMEAFSGNMRLPEGWQDTEAGKRAIEARRAYRENPNLPAGGGILPDVVPQSIDGLPMGDVDDASMKLLPAPTRRIDTANDARSQHPQKTGTIGVQVEHDGTQSKVTTKNDGDLFDRVKTKTQREAQASSAPGGA